MVCCICTDPRFGYVTDSLIDGGGVCPDTLVLLCRISMTVEAADNRWIPLAWFGQFAQACNPGVLLPPTTPAPINNRSAGEGMLFAGRKIPETIDLSLLRRWTEICDSEHENTCLLDKDDDVTLVVHFIPIDTASNHR
ncbi:hypothetical protein QBC36DRAFT_341144 [Triangularia setosa]|uniref:Uncharacterized protein n=1 Tax=Triangularia setosa TaxID=2587417 RepID=A0AAN7A2F4_9PEZI|nr:hypothetical protein QBC36DRAFT_341144 [Podospora setosa]